MVTLSREVMEARLVHLGEVSRRAASIYRQMGGSLRCRGVLPVQLDERPAEQRTREEENKREEAMKADPTASALLGMFFSTTLLEEAQLK